MTKVKDLVSCQSCKCFKVKRVDTVKGVLIKITEPDERTALTANKVENESKSCTTCREIKSAGLMQWCRKKNLAQAQKKLRVPTKSDITKALTKIIMPSRPRKVKNTEDSKNRIEAWEKEKQKVIEKRDKIKRDSAKKLYVGSNGPSTVNFACRHDTEFPDVKTDERVKAGWKALRENAKKYGLTDEALEHLVECGATVLLQEEGDVLYLDPGWAHWVLTIDGCPEVDGISAALSFVQWYTTVPSRQLSLLSLTTAKGEHREAQKDAVNPDNVDAKSLNEKISSYNSQQKAPLDEPLKLLQRGPNLVGVGFQVLLKNLPVVQFEVLDPANISHEAILRSVNPAAWDDADGTLDIPGEGPYSSRGDDADAKRAHAAEQDKWTARADHLFECMLGEEQSAEQLEWTEKVMNPVIDAADEAARAKGCQKTGPLNTRAGISALRVGHMTFKHAHHQGVVNFLKDGRKIWVFWPPGVDGHELFMERHANKVNKKRRRCEETSGVKKKTK